MNRRIRVYRAITYIILFYTAVAFFLLGHCGILKKDRTVAGKEAPVGTVEVRMDRQVQQVFLAEGTYLRYLELYVTSEDSAGDSYHLYLYDEQNEKLVDRDVAMPEVTLPGFLRIPIGVRTVPGTAYVWQLKGMTVPMELSYENTGETGLSAFGNFYVIQDGQTRMQEAQNIVMRLIYTDSPSGKKMFLLYAALVLAAGAGIGFAECRGRRSRRLSGEIRFRQAAQLTAGPVVLAALIFLTDSIFIRGIFGGKADDKLVYALGIATAAVCFAWFLFGKRPSEKQISFRQAATAHGMDWLQTGCFAGILWGTVHFMNAQYQIWQDLASREVLFWVFLLLLTMGSLRAVWNRRGAVWCLFATAAGIGYDLYCRLGLQTREPELSLVRYEILAAAAAGLVLLSLADKIRNRRFETAGLNRLYAVFLAVFLGLLVIFRNTRGWPVYLAVVFGLFYLFFTGWENRDRLMHNFCSGILLHFVTAVIFAMARRPYRAWEFTRYNFIFHTVTVNAYYLTLVICALTVRLLAGLSGKKMRFSQIGGTLLLYGTAVSLLFLTLSRTGYLAVLVMTAVMVPFTVLFCFRQRLSALLRDVLIMALAFPVCLPMTYTGIRILPALYNDPYIYSVEESAAAIHRDDPKDSNAYMSVSYFRFVMEGKLFAEAAEPEPVRDFLRCFGDTLYVLPDSVLVASEGDAGLSDAASFSNGRLDIFRRYIREWNLTGHDGMGVTLADGSVSVHAHNIYLQVIHDHGLPVGCVFLLLGAVSAGLMASYALHGCRRDPYAALPLAVLIGFAVAGLVEWLFHPCNPMGFSVMVVLAPLLYTGSRKKQKAPENARRNNWKVSK